jgi:hypothetical protein
MVCSKVVVSILKVLQLVLDGAQLGVDQVNLLRRKGLVD